MQNNWYLISSFAEGFFKDIRWTTSSDCLHLGLGLAANPEGVVPNSEMADGLCGERRTVVERYFTRYYKTGNLNNI